MTMNNTRELINGAINALYDAQKDLIADNGSADVIRDLDRAVAYVNDAKDEIAPVAKEEPAKADANHDDSTKDPFADIDAEMEFLKQNLNGFSVDDFGNAYRRGIPAAVSYLIDLVRPGCSKDVRFTTDADGKISLFFKAEAIELWDNRDAVVQHMTALLGFAGYDVTDRIVGTSMTVPSFTFELKRKEKPVNNYRIAPILMLAKMIGIV